MGYLQIERQVSNWKLKINGQRAHGVLGESREDLIHWALWKSRGRIHGEFIAPLAFQSVTDSVCRAQQAKGE